MKPSQPAIRFLAIALLSAALLAAGGEAGAVELSNDSVSAICVDADPTPSSASQAKSQKKSNLSSQEADLSEQYPVTYQSKSGNQTTAYVTAPTVSDVFARIQVDTCLNVRQGPGTTYSVLCTVENGAVLSVTGKTDGWYQILCNGQVGYVSATTTTNYAVLVDADGTALDAQAVFPESTTPADSAVDSSSPLADQIVAYALQYKGYPYVYGKAGPYSFDCSGFTSYVYAHFGYTLHRSSKDQVLDGVAVSKANLQPGDILLFSNRHSSGTIGHVGIYIGNNQFIHASTSSTGVIISDLTTDWYVQHYIGARRIL